MQEDLEKGQWLFNGPLGSKKSDAPSQRTVDNLTEKVSGEFVEKRMSNFLCNNFISRSKLISKGHGKLFMDILLRIMGQLRLFFACFVSANQFSLYGTVAEMFWNPSRQIVTT